MPASHVHHSISIFLITGALLLVTHHHIVVAAGIGVAQVQENSAPPGISSAELLRSLGWQADEFFVTTSSGYVLRLTRGRNPAIPGGSAPSKDPVVFFHGILAASNYWLLNSVGARPRDLTSISLAGTSLESLIVQLNDEPSAKALPLLSSNCGHEIWLVERRGTPGSRYLVGDPLSIKSEPSKSSNSMFALIYNYMQSLFSVVTLGQEVGFTLDVRYWNYSLDEQAKYDVPECIDYVLKNTASNTGKAAIVGHSAGGALTLMSLSLYPREMTRMVSVAIVWAPAYAVGNDNPGLRRTYGPLIPVAETLIGPLPPPFTTIPSQAASMLFCSPPPFWTTVCESMLDMMLGDSGGQQPATPRVFAGRNYPSSTHELAQLGQNFNNPNGTMRHYDYGEAGNRVAYGQSQPPAYDLSSISNFSAISFYTSATDGLVTPADVRNARAQLRVPSQYHLIDTTFNHIGYFTHVDAPSLVIIRTMQELETLRQ